MLVAEPAWTDVLWTRNRRTGAVARWTRHTEHRSLTGDVLWDPATPPGRRTFPELLAVGDVFDEVPEASRDVTGRARVRALLTEADGLASVIAEAILVPDRIHDRRAEIDRELAAYVPDLLATIGRVEKLVGEFAGHGGDAALCGNSCEYTTSSTEEAENDGAAIAWSDAAGLVRAALHEGRRCARCAEPLDDPDGAPVGPDALCTACSDPDQDPPVVEHVTAVVPIEQPDGTVALTRVDGTIIGPRSIARPEALRDGLVAVGGAPATPEVERRTNETASFLPQHGDGQRPAIRVGSALVFAYWSDGVLRVTADTQDLAEETVPVRVDVNAGTVWVGDVR